jgi:hypothetical protein
MSLQEWQELDAAATAINQLRGRLSAAKLKGNKQVIGNVISELEQAMVHRDALLCRLVGRIERGDLLV